MKNVIIYLLGIILSIMCCHAFTIGLISPENTEYNYTDIPLEVNFSDNYFSWGYLLIGIDTLICNNSPGSTLYFSGGETRLNNWVLSGNNDAQIKFSGLPDGPYKKAEICFLLYDADQLQEEELMFRINDGTPYSIIDDYTIPVGTWVWTCKDIMPIPASDEFNITMWYSDRNASGGIYIANSIDVASSASYWNADTGNADEISDGEITWYLYGGDTDWAVNLSIETIDKECPLNYSATLDAIPGNNTIDVYVDLGSNLTHKIRSFEVIGITDLYTLPETPNENDEAIINAMVSCNGIDEVKATIIGPDAQQFEINLYDDGLHDDTSSGDYIFGNSFIPLMQGTYSIDIVLVSSMGNTDHKTIDMTVGTDFIIELSKPSEELYNETAIDVCINSSTQYIRWYYSLDGSPNITGCEKKDSSKEIIFLTEENIESTWIMNSSRDSHAKFVIDESDKVVEKSEFCVYLYDNDYLQEDEINFRINDGETYSILDDETVIVGNWTWHCMEFTVPIQTLEYNITMWYSNRSEGGGITIANNKQNVGSSSYFNEDNTDAPLLDDWEINWTPYMNNTDWVMLLNITYEDQMCNLYDCNVVQAQLGNNQIIVYAEASDGEIASQIKEFFVQGIDDIITAQYVKVDETIDMIADTVHLDEAQVYMEITGPDDTIEKIQLFDDGLHGDGFAEDKRFAGQYEVDQIGKHEIEAILNSSNMISRKKSSFDSLNEDSQILYPVDGSIINDTSVKAQLLLPSWITGWEISLDDGPLETGCQSEIPGSINISYTDGSWNGIWVLKGDNDANILFDTDIVPQGEHEEVSFCFYVYDMDPVQEESLNFKVNDGENIYSIDDDNINIPAGTWTWVCSPIESTDFSNNYSITFWYSDRNNESGLYIANDNFIAGSKSQFDQSEMNAEIYSDDQILWTKYPDDSDWMVEARITHKGKPCNNVAEYTLITEPGIRTLTVYLFNDTLSSNMTTQFEIIGVDKITMYPKSVKPGNNITITAEIDCLDPLSTTVDIIDPKDGTITSIPMADDGSHGDGLPGDNIYGAKFKAENAGYYDFTVRVDAKNETSFSRSSGFGSYDVKAGVLYSNTTEQAGFPAGTPDELNYIESLTSVQHELVMAGIPYDMLGEEDLLDPYVISQYDALVFVQFRNVIEADYSIIKSNLLQAVRENGMNILAIGDFFIADENNTDFVDPDEFLHDILNVNVDVDTSVDTGEIIVSNNTHPLCWRYEAQEVLFDLNGESLHQLEAHNSSLYHEFPIQIKSGNDLFNNFFIGNNGNGRVFYADSADIISQTAIARDAILWLIYGDLPHVGIKLTDKNAVFTSRVDADVSYDSQQNIIAISNYRNVTEPYGLRCGWHIVTNHSGIAPINWNNLKPYYLAMYEAGHEIGSHSESHPGNMNNVSDEQAYHEMKQSKIDIDRELGLDIPGFVNPGDSPAQMRLWRFADKAGYIYYSPLDERDIKGMGFIDNKNDIVSLQSNILSDYQMSYESNLSINDTIDGWIAQYDRYYDLGDGIFIYGLWHDYLLDEAMAMYDGFTSYVGSTDVLGITAGEYANRFLTWNNQGFDVDYIYENDQLTSINITRTTPDINYAQLTLPPGKEIMLIVGEKSWKKSIDNRSYIFEFEEDSIQVTIDEYLKFVPVGKIILHENDTIQLLLNYSYSGNDSLTFRNGYEEHTGVVFDSATGSFIWNTGFEDSGNHSVYFNVTDGILFDSLIIDIELLNTNRIPKIEPIADIYADETDIVVVMINASDEDNNNNVTNDDNILTYYSVDPRFENDQNVFTWNTSKNDSGEYVFIFGVSDGIANATQNVNINISDTINEPPTLAAIDDIITEENKTLVIQLQGTDPEDDMLNYSYEAEKEGDHFIDGSTGIFTWNIGFNDSGTWIFEYFVSDGSHTDSKNCSITIDNINRKPLLSSYEDIYVEEGNNFTMKIDASDPDADILTYGSDAEQVLPGNISFDGSDGQLIWNIPVGSAGVYQINVNATDGNLSDNTIISFIVNHGNLPPKLEPIYPIVVNLYDLVTITANATDPNDDPLSYNINDTRFFQQENVFTYTTDSIGEFNVLVTAGDGLLNDTILVNVIVRPEDLPKTCSDTWGFSCSGCQTNNTIDSCMSSSCSEYENVDEIILSTANAEIGSNISVEANVVCNDNATLISIAYNDGSGWINIYSALCNNQNGLESHTTDFTVTGDLGTQWVRVIAEYNGQASTCCSGSDCDNDDVSFNCISPLGDADSDGVGDGSDLCPYTPQGETVGPEGCSCSQLVCDDMNQCTDDSCTDGICSYVTDDYNICEDGNFCTVNDHCSSGICIFDERDCSDEYSCTIDTCDESSNLCINTENNDLCSYPEICNPYIFGSPSGCGLMEGCDGLQDGTSCEDGNYCTIGDFCLGGICTSGNQRDCSSFDGVCTIGICNESIDSCESVNEEDGTQCDDGLFCSVNDTCLSGTCISTESRDCNDVFSCTLDQCDEVADSCVNVPDDNLCTSPEVCAPDYFQSTTGCGLLGEEATCSGVWGFSCAGCQTNNTFDSCMSSSCAEYENIQEVRINNSIARIGDSVHVTAEVICNDITTMISIAYNNGNGWENMYSGLCVNQNGLEIHETDIVLGGNAGEQWIRAIAEWGGQATICCTGSDCDNDDVKLQVI